VGGVNLVPKKSSFGPRETRNIGETRTNNPCFSWETGRTRTRKSGGRLKKARASLQPKATFLVRIARALESQRVWAQSGPQDRDRMWLQTRRDLVFAASPSMGGEPSKEFRGDMAAEARKKNTQDRKKTDDCLEGYSGRTTGEQAFGRQNRERPRLFNRA